VTETHGLLDDKVSNPAVLVVVNVRTLHKAKGERRSRKGRSEKAESRVSSEDGRQIGQLKRNLRRYLVNSNEAQEDVSCDWMKS
jgi:hypothetical protein